MWGDGANPKGKGKRKDKGNGKTQNNSQHDDSSKNWCWNEEQFTWNDGVEAPAVASERVAERQGRQDDQTVKARTMQRARPRTTAGTIDFEFDFDSILISISKIRL